ncbi:helix-turn-helix domain-containing protein [Streptomyces sp. NPDC058008]|uniref:helix-turn-helix domain-containing protein n=1 Tax=Streptomyces sp. NPDC058008 TaxID=3346303 RepID=UPI0036F05ACE
MDTVGGLLREWRHSRRLSQMELALGAGVSPRYVSLVETGRSRPTAGMVLRLADRLDVPLRHRNRLLVAAGFAPRYHERPLDGPDMAAVRDALVRVLSAHEPYPALVVDRRWNIVMFNAPVEHFLAGVDPGLLAEPVNMVRLGLDPRGLAPLIVNLEEVRSLFRARLSRQVRRTGDPVVAALYDEFFAEPEQGPGPELGRGRGNGREYGDGPGRPPGGPGSEVATPMVFRFAGGEVRLFSTVTTFGTPQDIVLDEISVESYYPADAGSAAVLRRMAGTRPEPGPVRRPTEEDGPSPVGSPRPDPEEHP